MNLLFLFKLCIMNNSSIDDLYFYADTLNEIQRFHDAFKVMLTIIERQPKLTQQQQILFASVCKSIIDPNRKSLEVLRECTAAEDDSAYTERLKGAIETVTNELISFSEEIIGIISGELLENASDNDDIVF